MKQRNPHFIRYCLLLGLIFMLDSCRLFRRREPSYNDYPTNNTTTNRRYNSRIVNQLIEEARTYTGVPYRSGGNDYSGVDCSGLLCTVYKSQGFSLPRISYQQAEVGVEVAANSIRPGDLLFFVTGTNGVGRINHTGLVTEVRNETELYFIHASSSKGVREDNLWSRYWKACFVKAIRPF
jgi:cell wall-associated NlpC family hydrolase